MATQATNDKAELDRKRLRQCGILLERLYSVAMDDNTPAQTQVAAATKFLAKFMPDLKAIEHQGEIDHEHRLIEVKFVNPDQRP